MVAVAVHERNGVQGPALSDLVSKFPSEPQRLCEVGFGLVKPVLFPVVAGVSAAAGFRRANTISMWS